MKKSISLLVGLLGFIPSTYGATFTVTPYLPNPGIQDTGPGAVSLFIGSYIIDASEAVAVLPTEFNIVGENLPTNAITGAFITDQYGRFIAGPSDSQRLQNGLETLTFTTPIVYPNGQSRYFVRGVTSFAFTNNATFKLTTNPAKSWNGLKPLRPEYAVVTEDKLIEFPTMTVKKGWLKVQVYPTDYVGYNVSAGEINIKGLHGRLDTSALSEPVVVKNLLVSLTLSKGAKATDISNVRVYKRYEDTPQNTGTNILNKVQEGLNSIQFDVTKLVPDGFQDFVLKFDLAAGSIGRYQWSIPTDLSNVELVGLLSNQRIQTRLEWGNGLAPYFEVSGTPLGLTMKNFKFVGANADLAEPHFEFEVRNAQIGRLYRIESSVNLMGWHVYGPTNYYEAITESFTAGGTLVPQSSERFFRIVEKD